MAAERSFLNAVKWAYTANWGEKAFSSFFTFILAALLGPRDFGVVALAMIYIAFIQMFLNQGLVAALIQKKELRREHLDSVFWVNILLGLGLAVVSVVLSRWWAELNHVSQLSKVISCLSLCIPIEALAIVQMAILQRELDFKSLSLRANLSVLVGGIVGVSMAYVGYGVWALVGQQIVRDSTALLLLWKQSHWRPAARFSWKSLRELLRFSGSNFLAQLGTFADLQSGAILLGALFGPVAVGLYRLAERLVSAVQAIATSSIQAVSLPEFSRVQDQPEELKKSVLTCVRMCAVATLPAMAGLLAVSSTLVAVLGDKWSPASDVLKILSVLGMVSVFTIFTGPLLQALSRPHHLAALEWTRTLVGGAALVIAGLLVRDAGIQWQVKGIALARLAIALLLVTPLFLYLLVHLGRLSLRSLMWSVMPSAASGAAALGSVILFRGLHLAPGNSPLTTVLAEVLVGGGCGLAVLLSLDTQLRSFVVATIQRRASQPAVSKELA